MKVRKRQGREVERAKQKDRGHEELGERKGQSRREETRSEGRAQRGKESIVAAFYYST